MRAGTAAVVEELVVVTSGVLECVSQNRHQREVPQLIHLTRQRHRGVSPPCGRKRCEVGRSLTDTAVRCKAWFNLRLGPAKPKRLGEVLSRSSLRERRSVVRLETVDTVILATPRTLQQQFHPVSCQTVNQRIRRVAAVVASNYDVSLSHQRLFAEQRISLTDLSSLNIAGFAMYRG